MGSNCLYKIVLIKLAWERMRATFVFQLKLWTSEAILVQPPNLRYKRD